MNNTGKNRQHSNDPSIAITSANPTKFSKSNFSGGIKSTYELDDPIKLTEYSSDDSRDTPKIARVNSNFKSSMPGGNSVETLPVSSIEEPINCIKQCYYDLKDDKFYPNILKMGFV